MYNSSAVIWQSLWNKPFSRKILEYKYIFRVGNRNITFIDMKQHTNTMLLFDTIYTYMYIHFCFTETTYMKLYWFYFGRSLILTLLCRISLSFVWVCLCVCVCGHLLPWQVAQHSSHFHLWKAITAQTGFVDKTFPKGRDDCGLLSDFSHSRTLALKWECIFPSSFSLLCSMMSS